MIDDLGVEIDPRFPRELDAELIAQNARAHFRDLALGEIAELERAEGDADQPVDRDRDVRYVLDSSNFSPSRRPIMIQMFGTRSGSSRASMPA